MKFYWIKTHWLIQKLFSALTWSIPNNAKIVYLTFDDGPTPEITDWTLAILKEYNAKATFFCIGENIERSPALFYQIQEEGHSVGNHTFNHLNGWETNTKKYLDNVLLCETTLTNFSGKNVKTEKLFRPPYGKLKPQHIKFLKERGYKIIMWDVLSADFDTTISTQQCADNVLQNIQPGSIIIFHDSIKAAKNLKYVLPQTLAHLQQEGYEMKAIRFVPLPS